MEFLVKHGRTYATKHDLNHRFEQFSKTYDYVKDHNENNKHVEMEINQFSDMSEEEFGQHYTSGLKLKHKVPLKPKLQVEALHPIVELPESIDWNALGKVTVP